MKTFTAIFGILILLITGCAKADAATDGVTSAALDEDHIPSIVFFSKTDYTDEVSDTDEKGSHPMYMLTFYDSEGNYFTCDDTDVITMSAEQLVKAYESGELKDKLKPYGTIGKDEITEQALALARLYREGKLKNAELNSPEHLPAVQAKRKEWYGLYYDEDGTLHKQILHSEQCSTDINMTGDDLNSIYEWIKGSFARKKMD